MKKITLTLIAIVFALASFAQTGTTCNDAIPESANNTCVFTNYTTSGLEMWFSWTATSTYAQITLVNQAAFGTNAPHIHNIALLEGTCQNLTQLEEDELPFLNPAAELTIDASGLIIGNTYFIRVQREATSAVECFQGACFPVVQNASFDLCIQDIDVFIPLDFNLNNFGFLEKPTSSHIYYTNKGQLLDTDGNPIPGIRQYTNATSPAIYLSDTSISYVFAKIDTIPATIDTLHRVEMKLVGGNPAAKIFRTEKTQGRLNYYLAHIPTGITNIKGYSRAVCNNVYPNIDMQYYSNSEGLKYYFIVHSGGNADNIVMRFDGANSVDVTGTGGLRITTSLGSFEYEVGHAYQINPSGPTTISPMPWQAEFVKVSANEVKFDVRNYPKNKPLIIQVDMGHKLGTAAAINNLEWCTYAGGVAQDNGRGITTDSQGNIYVTGNSYGINFPVTPGAFQTVYSGSVDAIAMKFFSNGILDWATYYGGDTTSLGTTGAGDSGSDIAVDNLGNVYFVGKTQSKDFPTFSFGSAYYNNFVGNQDFTQGFIVKLDTADGFPIWASFLGDEDYDDEVTTIAIDVTNNVYVGGSIGQSTLTNITTTKFPLVNPGTGAYFRDVNGSAYIAKFNVNNELVWSTLLATRRGTDDVKSIHIDKFGNLFVTGDVSGTFISDFVFANDGGGYLQTIHGGGIADVFIMKFTNTGVLFWSTLFGGSGTDDGRSITTDGLGNVYVTGITSSDSLTFPLFNPGGLAYFDESSSNTNEIFILKFNNNGVRLWSTFYGGIGDDRGHGITVDKNNNVYITGTTSSPDFFTLDHIGTYFQSDGADFDAYVIVLAPTLELLWATYIGGLSGDLAQSITVFQDKLYLTGTTTSDTLFPLVDLGGGAFFQDTLNGGIDMFIARFGLGPMGVTGIEDKDITNNSGFIIYPNPVTNKVILEINNNKNEQITISIYNVTGQKIYTDELKNINGAYRKELDVSTYFDGIYFIVVNKSGSSFAKKLVKQ